MSRRCDICCKQTEFGNAVSHSNRKTRRKWIPNLVDIRVNIDGKPQKIRICTKCLKSNKVEKVV